MYLQPVIIQKNFHFILDLTNRRRKVKLNENKVLVENPLSDIIGTGRSSEIRICYIFIYKRGHVGDGIQIQ